MSKIQLLAYRKNRKAHIEAFATQREAKAAMLSLTESTCAKITEYVPDGGKTVTSAHLGTLLAASVRYALGRDVNTVSGTAHIVRRYLDIVEPEAIIVLVQSIEASNSLGEEAATDEWKLLKSQLISKLNTSEAKDALTSSP